MPIVAIEGPDKCGKSTLFAKLQCILPAKFLCLPSYGKSRIHIASELALRDLELWETFYDPGQLYISDRHVIVSDAVYSKLYGRQRIRGSTLASKLKVLYIDTPVAELVARHAMCNEDIQDPQKYATVKAVYKFVLQDFRHRVLPSVGTVEDAANLIWEMANACS